MCWFLCLWVNLAILSPFWVSFGEFWRILTLFICFWPNWPLVDALGCFFVAFGCFWALLALFFFDAFGSFWLLLATFGHLWRFWSPNFGHFCSLVSASGQRKEVTPGPEVQVGECTSPPPLLWKSSKYILMPWFSGELVRPGPQGGGGRAQRPGWPELAGQQPASLGTIRHAPYPAIGTRRATHRLLGLSERQPPCNR